MRWFETPNFNFVGSRKIAYVVSGVLIAASIVAIISKGLQYGIDFKGGKEFVLAFQNPVEVEQIRSSLTTAFGENPEVKEYGSSSEILIRTGSALEKPELERIIGENMATLYANNPYELQKSDAVSARFSEDLKSDALQAIIYSIAAIFLYILLRFRNWTFSTGAVAALVHDVTITLGIFTILSGIVGFNLQLDQAIIAAFLTIVGYSLNDTVVVFDRIRENSRIHKGIALPEMINRSLNDTLSRTVITSVTTLFVVVVLFIFGGEVLKGFAFALIIGIILGTYSSLYVASALVVELEGRTKKSK